MFSVIFKQKVSVQSDIGHCVTADRGPERNNVPIPNLVMGDIGQQIVFGLTLDNIDILNVVFRLGFPAWIVEPGLDVVDVFVGDT